MTPTNRLRFVEREDRRLFDAPNTYRITKVRILQQWWE
jgi:hypothetical protein